MHPFAVRNDNSTGTSELFTSRTIGKQNVFSARRLADEFTGGDVASEAGTTASAPLAGGMVANTRARVTCCAPLEASYYRTTLGLGK